MWYEVRLLDMTGDETGGDGKRMGYEKRRRKAETSRDCSRTGGSGGSRF